MNDEVRVAIGDWCGVPSGHYDTTGVQWTISTLTGWFDGPPSRAEFTDRPMHDGAFPTPEFAGARVVVVEGRIGVDDHRHVSALDAARARTQALLRHGDETLTVTSRTGASQGVVTRSDKPTCDPVGALAYDFSVQVTAVDPIRYGVHRYRAGATLTAQAHGGLDFSNGGLEFPLSFGTGSSPTMLYLPNNGTADTAPMFRFLTPVAEPVLINAANGGRLEYLGDVAAGQQLTIDTATKAVLLSGVSRRARMGRADFDAFDVPAEGVLRVQFGSLDYPTDGAQVEATWREGWW